MEETKINSTAVFAPLTDHIMSNFHNIWQRKLVIAEDKSSKLPRDRLVIFCIVLACHFGVKVDGMLLFFSLPCAEVLKVLQILSYN